MQFLESHHFSKEVPLIARNDTVVDVLWWGLDWEEELKGDVIVMLSWRRRCGDGANDNSVNSQGEGWKGEHVTRQHWTNSIVQ